MEELVYAFVLLGGHLKIGRVKALGERLAIPWTYNTLVFEIPFGSHELGQ